MKKMVASLAIGVLLTGCSLIMLGTKQKIAISSNPTGAKVTVGRRNLGETPVIASLARRHDHIVKIELAGYKPYELALTKKISGWVFGNIIFGGLIGLFVDAMTGSMYMITPENISAVLMKSETENVTLNFPKDMLVVAVGLEVEEGWQKVGQLTPEAVK